MWGLCVVCVCATYVEMICFRKLLAVKLVFRQFFLRVYSTTVQGKHNIFLNG